MNKEKVLKVAHILEALLTDKDSIPRGERELVHLNTRTARGLIAILKEAVND